MVFRVVPYVPLELVAKIPLAHDGRVTSDQFLDLLVEDQLIKMVAHEDFVCQVVEEIIDYNPKTNEITGLISIVESAKNDLAKIVKIW